MPANLENSAVATRLESFNFSFHFNPKEKQCHRTGKFSFQFSFQSQRKAMPQDWKVFISIPKKSNAKECINYHTISLISHTCKVMLKILQAKLQQYFNPELPDVQARSGKGRGTRDQIVNIHWIIEKAKEFHKNIYFCFIDYAKAFDSVDHNELWKILKKTGIP